MKKTLLIGFIIGAAALFFIGLKLFPNDEKKIRSRIQELAETISFKQDEGNISKITKSNRIGSFFSEDVSMDLQGISPEFGVITGRGEIVERATLAYKMLRALKVTMSDTSVRLAPEAGTATVFTTALVLAPGFRDSYAQELKISLRKSDDGWVITHVTGVKTLQ